MKRKRTSQAPSGKHSKVNFTSVRALLDNSKQSTTIRNVVLSEDSGSKVVLQSRLDALDMSTEKPGVTGSRLADSTDWVDIEDKEEEGKKKKKQRGSQGVATRIQRWLPYSGQFLEEMLCHEGLADISDPIKCPKHDLPAVYRCCDCVGSEPHCRDCVCDSHRHLPLHHIQKWENGFWDKTSLFELGLELQIGHSGGSCPLPSKASTNLLVFDTSGVHKGKISLYDFYHAILKKSNNTGIGKEVFRWNEISTVVRQWRYLKMLKRAGRGHILSGIEGTADGSCAVLCPAYPQPGMNLPEGWKNLPLSERWKHRLILAIDGCFKLKLKARGIKDEELDSGGAYFVHNLAYQAYLATCKDEREISPCTSELNAIKQSHKKGTNSGLSVTGVLGVKCARHAFVLPNGIADLQKGERFCNVDYAVLSALKAVGARSLLEVDFSFDIACSWFVNFFKRLQNMPEGLGKIVKGLVLRAFVPKAHIKGHGPTCRTRYSFNYHPHVGRTHGETIEQEWAHIGPLMTSTREMGPGARHSTLDDHWGWWNWQKVVSLGKRLMKDLLEASRMASKQSAFAATFTASFPPDVVQKWRNMIAAWILDHRSPDPYAEPEGSSSMATVRKELAEEEAREAILEGDKIHEKMGPAAFICWGLELEERQHVLRKKVGSLPRATLQQATLQEKRTSLTRHIRAWYLVHALYIPSSVPADAPELAFLITSDSETQVTLPVEELKLWLPSQLDTSTRTTACLHRTAEKETRLRRAQMEDALIELRRLRRIYSSLLRKFKIHIAGTGRKSTTRSQSDLQAFNSKIGLAVARYRDARVALLALDPSGSWQEQFKVLKDEDNRGPGREEDERSEGHRQPSWIWSVYAVNSDILANADDEQLRAEWAKAVARAQRWEEEKDLILEEMGRSLRFLEAKSSWWDKHVCSSADRRATDIVSGLHGYARRQAAMYRRLIVLWVQLWRPVLRRLKLMAPWDKQYNSIPESKPTRVVPKLDARRPTPSTANLPDPTDNSSDETTEGLLTSGADDASVSDVSDYDYLSD